MTCLVASSDAEPKIFTLSEQLVKLSGNQLVVILSLVSLKEETMELSDCQLLHHHFRSTKTSSQVLALNSWEAMLIQLTSWLCSQLMVKTHGTSSLTAGRTISLIPHLYHLSLLRWSSLQSQTTSKLSDCLTSLSMIRMVKRSLVQCSHSHSDLNPQDNTNSQMNILLIQSISLKLLQRDLSFSMFMLSINHKRWGDRRQK